MKELRVPFIGAKLSEMNKLPTLSICIFSGLLLLTVAKSVNAGQVTIENLMDTDIVALPIVYRNNSSNINNLINNLDVIIPAHSFPVFVGSNWQIGYVNILDRAVYDQQGVRAKSARDKQLLPGIGHWSSPGGPVNGSDGGLAIDKTGIFKLRKFYAVQSNPERIYEIPASLLSSSGVAQSLVMNKSQSPVTVELLKDNGGKPSVIRSVVIAPNQQLVVDGSYLRLVHGKQTTIENAAGVKKWLLTNFGVYYSKVPISQVYPPLKYAK